MADMRSYLMVSDGILAHPSVALSRVEGSPRTSQVAITRTDVSVLDYSVFNVQQSGSEKTPLLYSLGKGLFKHPKYSKRDKTPVSTKKKSLYYIVLGEGILCIAFCAIKYPLVFHGKGTCLERISLIHTSSLQTVI